MPLEGPLRWCTASTRYLFTVGHAFIIAATSTGSDTNTGPVALPKTSSPARYNTGTATAPPHSLGRRQFRRNLTVGSHWKWRYGWTRPGRRQIGRCCQGLLSHRRWRFVGNTAQLVHVEDLLTFSTGTLPCADDTINLAKYNATGTDDNPQSPGAARYDDTLACQLRR
jgi:hypothetical protein